MAPIFYQIELSSRLLTGLLVALALLMVMAFAFGFGAAWSVFERGPTVEPAGPPVLDTSTPTAVVGVATATPAVIATATRRPSATPTATSTRTPRRIRPTATPRPVRPTAVAGRGYWVQVLAVTRQPSIAEKQKELEDLGFPRTNQVVVSASTVDGVLYKLRYGPLPDKASADRVVKRMKDGGLVDAFVVIE